MFEARFLGQVALWPGPAGTPFYAAPPGGYFANPQGGPLMTEELTSPQEEHIAREFHCYRSPDGRYASVPFAMRDAYLAAGWVAADYSYCAGAPPHAVPVGGVGGALRGMGQGKPAPAAYPLVTYPSGIFWSW